MSSAPVEIVEEAYRAFATRDIAKIFALFSPDIEIVQSTELPWGGVFRGHDGARQFFAKLTLHINSTLEIERYVRAGDQVVAVGWTQGNVVANGAKYRIPIAHVWKVEGAKIVRVQFLIDNPVMLEALQGREE